MPEWLHSLLLRLKAVRHRRRLDQDLEDEIAFHLAMKAECSGDTEARRQFGNVALQKESLREAWSFPRIESWLQDARHAVRALSKTPVFATVAILSLAIGIGANASIFTVLNTFFLRSLPVQNPQDLRVINWTGKPGDLVHSSSGYGSEADGIRTSSSFSFEAFQEIEKQTTVLSSVAAFQNFRANAVARSQALVAPAQLVSGRFFETLGMQAALGRTLLPSDNTLGAPPVAVISWRLYERLYAANADALGSELRVDKVPCTVIGVLPPNVYGISATDPVDVYVPLARTDEFSTYELNDPNYWWIQVFARVKPGMTDSQVQAALDVTLGRIIAAHRASSEKKTEMRAIVLDGRNGLAFLARDFREFLLVLLIMVGLVLLIACANLANLMMARASARSRELAIRRAVGAGRLRLVRYLLTESMLLAFIGGLLGLLLAQLGTVLLTRMLFSEPDEIARVRPDGVVLVFTCGLSFLTALLFGIVPALRASGVDAGSCLKQAGASTGAVRQRLARALVVVQVSIAVVLVFGAGLFARTLSNLGRVELGFRPDHLLLFYVEPKRSGYEEQRLIDVYRRIQAKVSEIPGVQAVTVGRTALVSGGMTTVGFYVRGRTPKRSDEAYIHIVGERYLTTLGTPILLGRDLQTSDEERAQPVGIVNAALAKKFFTGNPIGQEFSFNSNFEKPVRIVGVAADAKYHRLRSYVPPTVYIPWMQTIESAPGLHFQIRTSVEPLSIAAAVRRTIATIDPTLPLTQVRTQEQVIDQAISRERTFAMLGGFFSGIALALACIGIYGLLAYSVTRRTGEFGIRMALGATTMQISWLVIRGTLLLVALGALIGTPLAFIAGKAVGSRLFGVKPDDPGTIALALTAIVASGLLAAAIPSRRAAKSDPVAALRFD